jgi:Xaa-Pro dipeptidase
MLPIKLVRNKIRALELEGVILTRRDNFSWLTGGKLNYVLNTTEEGVAYIYITLDDIFLITSNNESDRIMNEELNNFNFTLLQYLWFEDPDHFISRIVDGKKVGSDNGKWGSINIMSELIPLRSILSSEDQEKYRILGKEAALVVENICRKIEPGWRETDIQGEIARECLILGINPVCILVATDERVFKYRHPIPTNKPLQKYAMIVLGGERSGLNVSLTRIVSFGDIDSEASYKFDKVANIHASMITATQPGVQYEHFFDYTKQLYDKAGYPEEWKLHHQGGPTGYACREFIMTPETSGEISINSAFAWNPSITGTKSEDTFLLNEKGVEVITRTDTWPLIKCRVNNNICNIPGILVR